MFRYQLKCLTNKVGLRSSTKVIFHLAYYYSNIKQIMSRGEL